MYLAISGDLWLLLFDWSLLFSLLVFSLAIVTFYCLLNYFICVFYDYARCSNLSLFLGCWVFLLCRFKFYICRQTQHDKLLLLLQKWFILISTFASLPLIPVMDFFFFSSSAHKFAICFLLHPLWYPEISSTSLFIRPLNSPLEMRDSIMPPVIIGIDNLKVWNLNKISLSVQNVHSFSVFFLKKVHFCLKYKSDFLCTHTLSQQVQTSF